MHTVHCVVYLPWPSRISYPWVESSIEQSQVEWEPPFKIWPFFVNHTIEETKNKYKCFGELRSVSKNQGLHGMQGSQGLILGWILRNNNNNKKKTKGAVLVCRWSGINFFKYYKNNLTYIDRIPLQFLYVLKQILRLSWPLKFIIWISNVLDNMKKPI